MNGFQIDDTNETQIPYFITDSYNSLYNSYSKEVSKVIIIENSLSVLISTLIQNGTISSTEKPLTSSITEKN